MPNVWKCGKKTHFAKMCKSENKADYDMECGEFFIATLTEVNDVATSNDEWHSTLDIEDKAIKLKLDIGRRFDVLPQTIFNMLKTNYKIIPSNN